MPAEQRGLAESIAAVRGKEHRLDENPTTEQREHIEALKKQASGEGPPDKLSLLRQKLSHKPRRSRSSGFTLCTTESIGAMCWRQHRRGCEPIRARRGWTA